MNKLARFSRIFVVLLVCSLFLPTTTWAQNVKKGFSYLDGKDYEKAIEVFEKSIDKRKDVIAAKFGLGIVYTSPGFIRARDTKAIAYFRYVQKQLETADNQTLVYLEQEYGISVAQLDYITNDIYETAFLSAEQEGTYDAYQSFMDIYPEAKQYTEAMRRRDQLAFEYAQYLNQGESYMYFLDHYTDSDFYEEAKKMHDEWWMKTYNAIRYDGEMSSLLNFERQYISFPFDSLLTADKKIAAIAVSLNLYEPFEEVKRTAYDNYIRTAPYTELAFVALQRMIEADLKTQNWTSALQTLRQYQPVLGDSHEKLNNLIALLEANEQPITIHSAGNGINTSGYEYMPVVAADDSKMYFCGQRRPDNLGNEDIFVSYRSNGKWGPSMLIDGINTPLGNEAPLALSTDGTEMFVFSGTGGGDIYSSRKESGGWTLPAPIKELNSQEWDADALLTSDRQAILFASTRFGGHNYSDAMKFHGTSLYQSDMYVIEKTPGGWSKAINLGDVLNTPYCERSPMLHPDMKTLYFCSDGHGGMGGLDLFMAKRLSDTSWTEWSEPINLGKMINTPEGEWAYRISTDGTIAYFSAINNGNEDIMYMELPKHLRPEVVITISGKVTNNKGEVLDANLIWEDLSTGEKLGEAKTDPIDGSYCMVLPAGKNYGYFAQKAGYYPESGNIDVSAITQTTHLVHDIVLNSIADIKQGGVNITLNNLFFDTDSYTLRPESYPELLRVANLLKQNPDIKAEIAGHTDNQGSDTHNQELSENRAKAVVGYLVTQGCNAASLKAAGYGKNQAIADNSTEQGRAKNRRVELRVLAH